MLANACITRASAGCVVRTHYPAHTPQQARHTADASNAALGALPLYIFMAEVNNHRDQSEIQRAPRCNWKTR